MIFVYIFTLVVFSLVFRTMLLYWLLLDSWISLKCSTICLGSSIIAVHNALKGLCHGQKCLHLFSYSEAYHEQLSPIPKSSGSLDIALSNAHTKSPRWGTFQTVNATELASGWEINTELLVFAFIFGLCADVWKPSCRCIRDLLLHKSI